MPSSASILIFSSGPLCRNPRVLKEATTLGNAGYEVTVLTVAQHEEFEALDEGLLPSAPFRKVTLDRMSSTPTIRLISWWERLVSRLAREALVLGIEHPSALGPYHALHRLARAQKADLIIAHTELPLCIGLELLNEGRAVAADLEDWHSEDLLPETRRGRPLRLLDFVEGQMLGRARYSSTTSRALADGFVKRHGCPSPLVIPNTFPLSPAPTPKPEGAVPRFFWLSQTIGPGRGLEGFMAAWKLTRQPSRLVLLGQASQNYCENLLKPLPDSHRARVDFHPLVPPHQLPQVISEHTIGLALEPPEPKSRALTITNKLFHYMDAGLAILATPTPGQREVFSRHPEIGLLDDLSDPVSLATRLDDLLGEPGRLQSMGAAARQAAETEFCWEKNASVLLAAVATALEHPKEARP